MNTVPKPIWTSTGQTVLFLSKKDAAKAYADAARIVHTINPVADYFPTHTPEA